MNRNFIIIPVGDLEVNCVIYRCPETGCAVIFDPGDEAEKIVAAVENFGAVPKLILNTHCHYDHIGAVEKLKKKYYIPFMVHKDEKEYAVDPEKNFSVYSTGRISIEPDGYFSNGEKIPAGKSEILVIHTPGHTLGSCCFFIDGTILSGDTLFAGSVGRTDLYGGNEMQIIRSIKEKLLNFDDNTTIIPGHGRITSLKEEKRFNPFLQ